MISPAYAKYLQRQGGMPPSNGQTGGDQQQAAPYNPYNAGIAKAIEGARASLGMSEDQSNKALRSGIATFGHNIGNQPRVSGFLQNLGQIGRAALPAIGAYQNEEANAMSENNQIANQILNRQAQEQARLAQEEERTWRRDIAERQFAEAQGQHAEQRRHNSFLEQFKKDGNAKFMDFDGKPYRKLDAVQIRTADKLSTLTSANALSLKNINKKFEELKKLSSNNVFAPVGSYAEYANPVKDTLGKFSGNKALRAETAARKVLSAELGQLNTGLEATKSGGGKLGQGMYDRLKPFFADIEHDDLPTFEGKLKEATEMVDKYNRAAEIRHKYGISFDPSDLEEEVHEKPAQAIAGQPAENDQGSVNNDDYGFTEQ